MHEETSYATGIALLKPENQIFVGATGVAYINQTCVPLGPLIKEIFGPRAERNIDRMNMLELFEYWITLVDNYNSRSTFQEWVEEVNPQFLHLDKT